MLGFRFDVSDPYNKTTVRALKTGLRSNLSALKMRLEEQVQVAFKCETRGKKDNDGLPPASLATYVRVLRSQSGTKFRHYHSAIDSWVPSIVL